MLKQITQSIKNYTKKFRDVQYRKSLRELKSKLYMNHENTKKYVSNRGNSFRLLKAKLEFDNNYSKIAKINIYYAITGIFLLWCSIYLIVFSHYFSVKKIDIIPLDERVNENLVYKTIEDIRYTPILFVDKDRIKNEIISHQPSIEIIDIRKIYPDNIKITIGTYETKFYFHSDSKVYEISKNGVIIPSRAQQNNTSKINVRVRGLDSLGYLDYKKIFKEEHIEKMSEIIQKIKEKNSFVKINATTYYKKEAEFHITDENGSVIIFDLNKNIDIQIEKLNIFYKKFYDQIKIGIVYLDLRINEKIIYCPKSDENTCKNNLKEIYNN